MAFKNPYTRQKQFDLEQRIGNAIEQIDVFLEENWDEDALYIIGMKEYVDGYVERYNWPKYFTFYIEDREILNHLASIYCDNGWLDNTSSSFFLLYSKR